MPNAYRPDTQRARSMGAKLLIVCALALVMMIPALFVSGLVDDRSQRASEVVREISAHVGGPQTFLGPTLAIPYGIASGPIQGTYLAFPAEASADVHIDAEERRRSLFRVPVFQADARLSSTFDLTGVPRDLPPGATLDWNHAELVVGVSDPRGALADATFTSPAGTATLLPAQVASSLNIGLDPALPQRLTLLGAQTPQLSPGAKFTVTARLHFSGAQRLAVLAYGKSTQLTMSGNWPNPGFDGGLLPLTRTVTRHGFDAKWSVPFIARGIRAQGTIDSIAGLNSTALGVSLVELTDPYQSVNRSLKYAPLFISLVFLSYFLFEATTGKRVHPAQYVLVGIAQILFYLLLLSLGERAGFDWAFLLAGAATVALLARNASWVFASKLQGFRALGIFTFLYTLIYLLLRLEDNALLVGAMASFAALATAMYLTRNLDWYSSFPRLGPDRPESPHLVS